MSNEELAINIKNFLDSNKGITRNKICIKFGLDIRKLKKVAEEYKIALPPPLSKAQIGKLSKFNKNRVQFTI